MPTATEPLALNEGLDQKMTIQVTRIIRAKRERVYAAWTSPATITTWFGPANRVTTAVRVDLRIGGEYFFEMTNEDLTPKVASVSGVYTEIVPNERLRFTWIPTWSAPEETLVTVSLKDVPDGTEVTILHERFLSAESRNGHQQGWTAAMDKFARVLEA